MAGLKKAGANWVDGDRFFDRKAELDLLRERVRNGTHTLLTAQRRMGKTSLVREFLRHLQAEGSFETVFVDLEAADSAADAVAEVGSPIRRVLPRPCSGCRRADGRRARVPGHREHRDREAAAAVPIDDVLRVLEHDGYLGPRGDGYRFVSGLLEDWWRARHGRHFLPIERRPVRHGA